MNFILFKEINMTTLKKYSNRKIYSPVKKAYINLPEVLDLIRDGQVVQVVSHRTGEDVTAEVLREAIAKSDISADKIVTMVRS